MADKGPEDQEFEQNADPYYDDIQAEVNRKIAEKAAQDPDFRAHLQSDPDKAFEEAGLGDDVRKLMEESAKSAQEAGEDVSGHTHRIRTYYRTCRWYRYGLWWHWR